MDRKGSRSSFKLSRRPVSSKECHVIDVLKLDISFTPALSPDWKHVSIIETAPSGVSMKVINLLRPHSRDLSSYRRLRFPGRGEQQTSLPKTFIPCLATMSALRSLIISPKSRPLEFPFSIRAVRYFYCLTRFLRIIPWGARFLL